MLFSQEIEQAAEAASLENGIGALFRTTSTIGIDNSIQFFEDRIDCYLILLESNYREKHEYILVADAGLPTQFYDDTTTKPFYV